MPVTAARHSRTGGSIKVYVDADACPVKDEVYAVAARCDWPVVLVANAYIRVPSPFQAEMIVVPGDHDAADDWIAERVQAGDVVITADLPLAGRCLERGARVLGVSGRELTDASIGHALAGREIHSFLRQTGEPTRGPRPFSDRDRSRFRSKLDAILRG